MTKELQICNSREYVAKFLIRKYPKARKEDIEDIVQTAIVKAIRAKDQWRGETALECWLAKIAINLYIEMNRKSSFKNESLVCSEETKSLFENIIQEDFSETLCENNYLTSLYSELMLGLEDNISIKTFNLNVIDDIDYKEIATKQNISIAAVKSRVHRGKMMLQKKYREISYKYEETTV
jgi:RNA polymerase sigma-70 factor (ECF subfamily)